MEDNKPIFICEFKKCEKIFTTKYSLIRHAQTHMKKKNFKCKQCSKTFNIKQNLIEHEFVHTGEQPYVWNIDGCTQRFRQRGKLSLHRQSHTNYQKKAYRSHTSINDGDLNKRVQMGQQNVSSNWVSTNSIQTIPTQPTIRNLTAANTNLYVMANQMGKMNQLGWGQPLVSLSQRLPSVNYQFTQATVPQIRFIGSQLSQGNPSANLLPKLNLVMLPYQNMGGKFN